MLEELHEVATRIERPSEAEHDLISDVHPQVTKSRNTSKMLKRSFRPVRAEIACL